MSARDARRPLTFDLALAGGGAKGIALNAALDELFARGHRVRRVVGTSAGAIAATLLAAGFTGAELLALSRERTADDEPSFSEYVREPAVPASPFHEVSSDELTLATLPAEVGRRIATARAALAFLDRGGFVSGNGFVDWLCRVLETKAPGLSRASLGELHERTGAHLTVIVTDTTARRLRALNHVSAPRCPVVVAVRMSMSIPLLFTEVLWRAEWGSYLGEPLEGHAMVDGGMLSNLPIGFVLPGANALVGQLMGPTLEGEAIPLGMALDTGLEVPDSMLPPTTRLFPAAPSLPSLFAETRLGQRVSVLADTMMHGLDRTLADVESDALLRLPAGGYRATEFDMSRARVEALLAAARAATASYLDRLEIAHDLRAPG